MLTLSVLDQSTIASGRPPSAAIADSLELARHADRLGYARYWVSEHHNSDSIAGTAPEVLMAAIAATTTRIRVGSAGVMLPHYSPLKIAEQFRVLEAIAPGRIDLGVGRAPGSDRHTAFALNPNADRAADMFPAQIRDLLAWLGGVPLAEGHPFRDVRAQPAGPGAPEVWVLGSSDYGAQVAAFFGLPFCYAHFITDGRGAEMALDMYREQFQPSERICPPRTLRCACGRSLPTPSRKPTGSSPRARCGVSAATRAFTRPCPRPRRRCRGRIRYRNRRTSTAFARPRSSAPRIASPSAYAIWRARAGGRGGGAHVHARGGGAGAVV